MNNILKGGIIVGTFIASLAALFEVREWLMNKLEYRSKLLIILDENAPKRIRIFNNCFLGTDIKFNSGIGAVYAGESNLFIKDNLAGIEIRILDESTARIGKRTGHIPDSLFYRNSRSVVKIISGDSTSFNGLYKTILLK
ncbi:hypothetical protein MON38_08550 [Hymenobacter sp. DH14]|uniref:Uncharacterized protein n=1 Tax=Hymenobacter cyanobacteriorum TaxID=2926463 RepID=A0A9X1VE25_9BACT|nr:hypothetical protein [Hymenobacter cyanobacteriorum]MCI1187469.1 hypothetical protein [Hymenobacter cyanobacteriorum]